MNAPHPYSDQLRKLFAQVSSPQLPRRIAMIFDQPAAKARIVVIREPCFAQSSPQQLRQAVAWLVRHGQDHHPYMGKRKTGQQKAAAITATLTTFHIAAPTTGDLATTLVAAGLAYVLADSIGIISAKRRCMAAAHEIVRIIHRHRADQSRGSITEPHFEHIPANGISIAVIPDAYLRNNT